MRDLSVQAASDGGQDNDARSAAQTEFDQLNQELDRVGNTTSFGKTKLLDGTYGAQPAVAKTAVAGVTLSTVDSTFSDTLALGGVNTTAATAVAALGAAGNYTDDGAGAAKLQKDLQASIDGGALKGLVRAQVAYDGITGQAQVTYTRTTGSVAADTLTSVGGKLVAAAATTPTGTAANFQVGANNSSSDKILVSIAAVNATKLGTSTVNLITGAAGAVDTIDAAISNVSSLRANLGAYQNRFEHAINNLNVAVENLSASESRIRDTDMAQEMVSFTRTQILSQAGTSMLAQANQAPQSVLSLLRG
jgi:flagellin